MTKLEYWLAAAGKGANQVAIQEVIEGRAAIVPLAGARAWTSSQFRDEFRESVRECRLDTPVSQ